MECLLPEAHTLQHRPFLVQTKMGERAMPVLQANQANSLPSGRQVHRVAALDGLRGLAALVVVVHHCLLTQPAFSDYFFSNWATQPRTGFQTVLFDTPARIVWAGYEAVILFYVLSGLVLAMPWLEGRAPGYRMFLTKRICRIYLPYIVAVGAAALLSRAFTLHTSLAGLSDWVNTMNWSNPVTSGVLLNHVFLTGHHNVLNGPIHSLVWEMRVSALFPLIVVPVVIWGVRGAAGVAAILLVLIGLAQWRFAGDTEFLRLLTVNPGLGASGKLTLEVEWTAFFALFFVFGTLIAMRLRPHGGNFDRMPAWSAWACVLAGLLAIQAHWSHLELIQDTLVGAGSCLVIIGVLAPGPIRRALSSPACAWLGAISYSLYLVHVPLILAALILLHAVLPVWLILAGAIPASILVAWAFDRVVAKPSVRLGQRLAGARNGGSRAHAVQPV